MSEEVQQPAPPSDAIFAELTVTDWRDKYWGAGKIGFHKDHNHTLLLKHADQLLGGKKGQKVLVPLCGKAHDMKWFADQGHTVIGIEGVEQPILDFFKEQNLEFSKEPLSDMEGELYKSSDGSIRIYRCNIFDFTRSLEGDINAVWDRGAFVVINPRERQRYAKVFKTLAAKDCRVLIVTVDYDTSIMTAPPHVISDEVIHNLFDDDFNVQLLDRQSAMSDLWRNRGLSSYDEVVHFLNRK